MAGGDTLDFKIFGGVTSKFEDFGCEVFEDSGDIDGSCIQGENISLWVLDRFGSSKEVNEGNFWYEGLPLAPTRILFCVLFLRKRFTRPHGN